MERVASFSSRQGVVAALTINVVVSGTTIEYVVRGVAGQRVVAFRAFLQHLLDLGDIPDRAVGEFDLFDGIDTRAILTEVEGNTQCVVRSKQTDKQVVSRTGEPYLVRRHARAQFDNVRIRARSIVVMVVDGVLPGADAETVGVGAVATIEIVVPRAAVKHVIAVATTKIVIPGATIKHVVSSFALERVIARFSGEYITAGAAAHGVVAAAAQANNGSGSEFVRIGLRQPGIERFELAVGGRFPAPGKQPAGGVPAQPGKGGVDVHQVGEGFGQVFLPFAFQPGFEFGEVQMDAVFVDGQFDEVEVGF